jgi:hypothetical protein
MNEFSPQIGDEQLDDEAARAAEQQLQSELAAHPDLVVNQDKALEMAYASKAEEEGVVKHSEKAIEAMYRANTSDEDYYAAKDAEEDRAKQEQAEREANMSSEELMAERNRRRDDAIASPLRVRETPQNFRDAAEIEVEKQIDRAGEMRIAADQKAEKAGKLYDSVQQRTSYLKSGKQPPSAY